MIAPRISVLLPVYNAGKYLVEAIDSVLAQTFTDFEIILINDGSTDNSVEIAESYSDPRIKLFHNPQNLGLIATLNKGIELCSGEFIARMDADDRITPERFQIQLAAFEKDRNLCIAGGNYEIIGSAYSSVLPLTNDEIRCELFFSNVISHPIVMMRSSLFKETALKYNPEYTHNEDWKLWLDIPSQYKFINVPEVLLFYRMEGQNISVINQHSRKERYLKMYCSAISQLIGTVTKEQLAVHWSLSNGEAGDFRISALKNYIRLFIGKAIASGHPEGVVKKSIRQKLKKLYFSYANRSFWSGLTFMLNLEVFSMSGLIYLFKVRFRSNRVPAKSK